MFLIAREWNPPLQRGTRNAEVLQAGFQPAQDLVSAGLRLDEVRVLLDVLPEAVLVLGQLEEVVFFFQPLRLERRVDQAVAVLELVVLLECLARDAVPAFVPPLVDVALCLNLFQENLNAADMIGVLSADESVI